MRKVIFLDRDGVINNNALYYTFKVNDFVINQGLVEFLKSMSEKGFGFIVITNQGGISKNLFSKQDVANVHDFLKSELQKENIEILEIYYCPHHSDVENCLCRKPNTINVEKAIARFNINVSKSYFIGDQKKDAETAVKCGITPIIIEPNSDLNKIINKIL